MRLLRKLLVAVSGGLRRSGFELSSGGDLFWCSIVDVKWGRGGGGQVVSVLAFNSDDPSSNPAEACSSFLPVNCCMQRTKMSKKRLGF